MKNKRILILCKVVDNYGDVGVVFRLAKALSEQDKTLELTIVCSDLESFSLLTKNHFSIDTQKKSQKCIFNDSVWTILDWTQEEDFRYEPSPFPTILECFQCGRPEWLESILFSKTANKTFYIFNIEYLTAEAYAEEFHLLKSYTRSSNVKKMFFMPGFTNKTGGLIIDKTFMNSLKKSELQKKDDKIFTVAIFSYERSFDEIFVALQNFVQKVREKEKGFCVKVFAAAGKSQPFVKKSWEKFGKDIILQELDFLPQEEWDELLCTCDFNFVRGEESLARASLCAKPFVWHAYPQEENYQLVKVNSLLEKILPFIKDEAAGTALKQVWEDYNTPNKSLSANALQLLFEAEYNKNLEKDFKEFSASLFANGNLAENLLSYMSKIGL
ncbi:elongation factor P maturation arginine rhamnosyltransferase EarP [Treponema pectinovorum]|uniref:elongation factor P maturation arginine rhamnosyltransferase EarP n=1 Tax=Treponema pectinovorum TaxID=164 RepID=UPI0011C7109A|nr:elongation factor P maturation arginine rhamnosyltransferase EarP [Treponema pectinovorum]